MTHAVPAALRIVWPDRLRGPATPPWWASEEFGNSRSILPIVEDIVSNVVDVADWLGENIDIVIELCWPAAGDLSRSYDGFPAGYLGKEGDTFVYRIPVSPEIASTSNSLIAIERVSALVYEALVDIGHRAACGNPLIGFNSKKRGIDLDKTWVATKDLLSTAPGSVILVCGVRLSGKLTDMSDSPKWIDLSPISLPLATGLAAYHAIPETGASRRISSANSETIGRIQDEIALSGGPKVGQLASQDLWGKIVFHATEFQAVRLRAVIVELLEWAERNARVVPGSSGRHGVLAWTHLIPPTRRRPKFLD